MRFVKAIESSLCNLLPQDGVVYYYGVIMSQEQADAYFASLMQAVDWEHDQAKIYGKTITTKRKVAWYADELFAYTYSRITKHAKLWLPVLDEIKKHVEEASGETFNSCLLNLYHDGFEGMSWHSDAEKELKQNGAIASLSLGAERNFAFKHKKTKYKVSQVLEHGSLLVMKGVTQRHWLHQLPITRRVHAPRINLTFRSVDAERYN